jgi:ABC-type branched-subunit amino acid transport system ATPase component
MTPLLEARGLSAGYGGASVVRDLDLKVSAGEIVAILGPNGAGKTTTMLTLAGDLRPLAGEVRLNGEVTTAPLHRRARAGLALVTEERSVTMGLTVKQNIRLARAKVEPVVALFPELEALLNRRAGLLSGGEQQMLTLGRALSSPSVQVLLADELSLGLAPKAVGRLLRAVRAAADQGIGVLLVEQHVHRVLEIADRVIVLSHGSVDYRGNAAEARGRLQEIQASYFGSSDGSPSRHAV